MAEKKSTVSNVQATGTFESQYGIFYKYEVEMENGDLGEYSSKSDSQTKFVIGETVDYEFIDGQFPKIKPISTFQQSSGADFKKSDDYTKEDKKWFELKDRRISKLAILKDTVALIVADKINLSDWEVFSDKFLEYVYDNEEPENLKSKEPDSQLPF
jgi:hypothetical protein